MNHRIPGRGKIRNLIPPERYKILVLGEHSPRVGDIVQLDQGYTASNGDAMSLVYYIGSDSTFIYEAHLLDSDFVLLPE